MPRVPKKESIIFSTDWFGNTFKVYNLRDAITVPIGEASKTLNIGQASITTKMERAA